MSFPFASRPPWGRRALGSASIALALVGCGTTSRPTPPPTANASDPVPVSLTSRVPPQPLAADHAAVAFVNSEAAANSIDWTKPVSIEEVVAHIRARHPTTAAAGAAVAAAEAAVLQARAWDDPEAAITIGLRRGLGGGAEDDTPFGLSLTQPLGAFGARKARTAAARARVSASEAEAEATLRDLDHSVALALVRLVAEDENLALAEAHLAVAQNILAASQHLVDAGEIGQADAAQAQAAVAQAQATRDGQARVRASALAQVERWLGEDLPDVPQLTGIWAEAVSEAENPAAAGAHPALLAMDARIQAAEHALAAERAERWPKWSVGIEAARDKEEEEFALSIGFTLPVWNGNRGGVAAAQAERARAAADAATVQVQFAQATAEARATLAQALAEQQALAHSVVPAAQEALRLQQAAYGAGSADLPAVLNSRRALLDAQSQALASRRRAAEAQIELRALLAGFAPATEP